MSRALVEETLASMREEIGNTRAWRAAAVRPATDTTDFAGVPESGLRRIERWISELSRMNKSASKGATT